LPLIGANASRMNAKELITIEAAVTLTSKLRAKVGNAGATIPKPRAITKLTVTKTHTSRGSREAAGAAFVDVICTSAFSTPPILEPIFRRHCA
jgi:hypothetical protein